MNTHDNLPRCFVMPTFRPHWPYLLSSIRAVMDRRFFTGHGPDQSPYPEAPAAYLYPAAKSRRVPPVK